MVFELRPLAMPRNLALLLLLALVPLASCNPVDIYLSPDSTRLWNGSTAMVCTSGAPCNLADGASFPLDGSSDSPHFYFGPGNYGGKSWTLGGQRLATLSLSFAGVQNLTPTLTAGAALLSSVGLAHHVVRDCRLTLESTTLDVTDLRLSNSKFKVISAGILKLTNFETNGTSSLQLDLPAASSLNILRSRCVTTNISIHSTASVDFSNVEILDPTHFQVNAAALTLFSSSLRLLSSPLTFGATTITLTNCTVNSSTPVLSTIKSPLTTLRQCIFTDLLLNITNPSLTHVQFNQLSRERSIILHTCLLVANNVTFTNPHRRSSAQFQLECIPPATMATVQSTNGFIISDLHFATPFQQALVGELEVTQSLSSASPLPLTLTPSSSIPWKFHSITIDNVLFPSPPLPAGITYRATRPCSGIISSSPLFPPTTIGIEWPGALNQPLPLYNFPLFGVVASSKLPNAPGPDPRFAFNITDSNQLTFHRINASITGPTFNCEPAPPGCNAPTGFVCNGDGSISAPTDVQLPSLTLPPDSGIISVNGSVIINTTITFIGIGSQLDVRDCVSVGKEVVLDLEQSPASSPPKGALILITQSPECGSLDVPLSVRYPKNSGCKKMTVERDNVAPSHQLSVLFHIDNSQCNVKWIIIGASLGGVLLIVAVLVLIFRFNRKARNCIRPFSRRRAQYIPAS